MLRRDFLNRLIDQRVSVLFYIARYTSLNVPCPSILKSRNLFIPVNLYFRGVFFFISLAGSFFLSFQKLLNCFWGENNVYLWKLLVGIRGLKYPGFKVVLRVEVCEDFPLVDSSVFILGEFTGRGSCFFHFFYTFFPSSLLASEMRVFLWLGFSSTFWCSVLAGRNLDERLWVKTVVLELGEEPDYLGDR